MPSLRRKLKFLILAGAMVGLLVFLARSGREAAAPRWDQRAALALVGPVSGLLDRVAHRVSGFFRSLIELREAREETLDIRAERSRIQAELLQVREENFALRARARLFAETGTEPSQGRVARVIAYDPSPRRRSVTLDAGTEDGIRPDQTVLAQGGVVGRVLTSSPGRSRVLLITDQDSAVDVVAARTRARGVLVGKRRELGLKRERWLTQAEYVLASEEIAVGDLLMTSGQDGVFPPGFPVGLVENVEKDAAGLFWQAEVRPYAELQKLEQVLVLTSNTPL